MQQYRRSQAAGACPQQGQQRARPRGPGHHSADRQIQTPHLAASPFTASASAVGRICHSPNTAAPTALATGSSSTRRSAPWSTPRNAISFAGRVPGLLTGRVPGLLTTPTAACG